MAIFDNSLGFIVKVCVTIVAIITAYAIFKDFAARAKGGGGGSIFGILGKAALGILVIVLLLFSKSYVDWGESLSDKTNNVVKNSIDEVGNGISNGAGQ